MNEQTMQEIAKAATVSQLVDALINVAISNNMPISEIGAIVTDMAERRHGKQALIDIQYNKYKKLADASENEFSERKVDREFKKLYAMFPDHNAFTEYWNKKTDESMKGTGIQIVRK